jgi:hypothetical protein
MEDKLRRYIDGLFARTAPTKRAVELKEEMIQNLSDKYSDLLSEGKTPEAAYNIAVAGIGDVSGLLKELETDMVFEPQDIDALEMARQKTAMMTAIAVMLYILSVLPLIVLTMFGVPYGARIGVPVMFVTIATATGLLVYNNMTKPRFLRGSDTMVEEFREWQSESQQRNALRKAISAALWATIVALYFVISFWSFAWHISWIIFVFGAVAEAFINIFFTLKT